MKWLAKIKDSYINNIILFDIIGAGLVLAINFIPGIFAFTVNNKSDNIAILSDIVSASISLAGFILAALTIIVSMRSNIGNKTQDHAKSPMELFFSDTNYTKILSTFQTAIIELTLVFLISYLIWISVANISNSILVAFLFALFFIIAVCVVRTLSVLFMIINIDKPIR